MGRAPEGPRVNCVMCSAEMHRREYADHLRACVVISARLADLAELDARIAERRDGMAAEREQPPAAERRRRFGL